jgi:hypothetical protein
MPPEFACKGTAGRQNGQTGYVVIVGPQIDPFTQKRRDQHGKWDRPPAKHDASMQSETLELADWR